MPLMVMKVSAILVVPQRCTVACSKSRSTATRIVAARKIGPNAGSVR